MCLRHTRTVMMKKTGYSSAKMQCAEVPDETQLAQIKTIWQGKYQKDTGRAGIRKKPELIAGFVLRVGDIEEDFSIGDGLTDYNRN